MSSLFTLMQISFYSDDIRSDILPQWTAHLSVCDREYLWKPIAQFYWGCDLKQQRILREMLNSNELSRKVCSWSETSSVYFNIEWECLFIWISSNRSQHQSTSLVTFELGLKTWKGARKCKGRLAQCVPTYGCLKKWRPTQEWNVKLGVVIPRGVGACVCGCICWEREKVSGNRSHQTKKKIPIC